MLIIHFLYSFAKIFGFINDLFPEKLSYNFWINWGLAYSHTRYYFVASKNNCTVSGYTITIFFKDVKRIENVNVVKDEFEELLQFKSECQLYSTWVTKFNLNYIIFTNCCCQRNHWIANLFPQRRARIHFAQ